MPKVIVNSTEHLDWQREQAIADAMFDADLIVVDDYSTRNRSQIFVFPMTSRWFTRAVKRFWRKRLRRKVWAKSSIKFEFEVDASWSPNEHNELRNKLKELNYNF